MQTRMQAGFVTPLHILYRVGTREKKSVILPLDEVERRAIVYALKVTDNNIPDAARALGIGRTTLYRKMKKYNLLP